MKGCQHTMQSQQTKTVCKGVIVTLAMIFISLIMITINHSEFISLYVTKFVVITPFKIVCSRPIKLNLANKTKVIVRIFSHKQIKIKNEILLIFANLPMKRKCGLIQLGINYRFFCSIHITSNKSR